MKTHVAPQDFACSDCGETVLKGGWYTTRLLETKQMRHEGQIVPAHFRAMVCVVCGGDSDDV